MKRAGNTESLFGDNLLTRPDPASSTHEGTVSRGRSPRSAVVLTDDKMQGVCFATSQASFAVRVLDLDGSTRICT
jgi:hypothetical protein